MVCVSLKPAIICTFSKALFRNVTHLSVQLTQHSWLPPCFCGRIMESKSQLTNVGNACSCDLGAVHTKKDNNNGNDNVDTCSSLQVGQPILFTTTITVRIKQYIHNYWLIISVWSLSWLYPLSLQTRILLQSVSLKQLGCCKVIERFEFSCAACSS